MFISDIVVSGNMIWSTGSLIDICLSSCNSILFISELWLQMLCAYWPCTLEYVMPFHGHYCLFMISVKLWNIRCLTSIWCGLVPSRQQAIWYILRFNGATYNLIENSSVTPVWYLWVCCLSLCLVWFCFVLFIISPCCVSHCGWLRSVRCEFVLQ